MCQSQWPHSLRHRFVTARFLRSWVRIPPEAWMFVCCECCVLSGRGLCDGLITRPEESYRLWCVIVCDPETSRMRMPWPLLGRSATKKMWDVSYTLRQYWLYLYHLHITKHFTSSANDTGPLHDLKWKESI